MKFVTMHGHMNVKFSKLVPKIKSPLFPLSMLITGFKRHNTL